jgi:hypothetical protein
MVVLLVTVTLVAALPPNETVAPETKAVPVIETDVPPLVLPVLGEIETTDGAGVPTPPDFGRIVVSFFNAPGDVLR